MINNSYGNTRPVRNFIYQPPIITDTTNSVIVSASGWNYVTVTDSLGCTATDSIYVHIDVCGCTDSTALNYNASATLDDGSCIATVYGCMDSTAFNYNPSANVDDGSCVPFIYGCMDSSATNYVSSANVDDGSCTYCYVTANINNGLDSISACDSVVLSTNIITGGSYSWNLSNLTNPSIGDFYEGGVVFYIDSINKTGLIASITQLQSSLAWGCQGVNISGNSTTLGSGQQNTIDIIANSCISPAAEYCNNLISNGYDDWYLPSLDELNELYLNKNLINNVSLSNGGVVLNPLNNSWGYWSSSQHHSNPANASWEQKLYDGSQWINGKGSPAYVRAIRTFNYNHNPSLTVSTSGWTYVTVTDSLGCTATDSIYVHIDICGCTDSTALNYNASATLDDGSCIASVFGCMDSTAFNYNPNANVDDGSCVPFIYGCMDSTAYNYDPTANTDDGSCGYCDLTATLFSNPDPTSGTNCAAWILVTPSSSHTPFTYLWSNGATSNNIFGLCNGIYTVTITDAVGCSVTLTDTIGSTGCTDPTATNYDPNAIIDDGSCVLCVYGCTDPISFNYDSLATCDDGSCIAVVYGCTDPGAVNYFPGSNVDDGSCCYISGCTDPAATNYDPNACFDDGSCIISTTCNKPTPTGLHVIDIIHNRARVKWDNMSSVSCTPEQYRVQYRVQGTSAWSTKNAVNTNNCGTFNQTGRLLTNLLPATTYEYRMKAWYCFTSGASTWTSIHTFTTLDACPNVANFTVSTPTTTRATFTWDDSNGPYSFVRIKFRVDSIANPTGADWQNAGGFGVNYGTWTRNKNGLTPGQSYRGQSRTWCDPQGGAYKSSGWTPLIFWTQPTSVKVEGEFGISNLDIYPNPSRDIFNIEFTSEEAMDFRVRGGEYVRRGANK